jgi:hypothetical protein
LRDVARSEFVHVIDQYTGRTDNDRYTLGRRAKVNFKALQDRGSF